MPTKSRAISRPRPPVERAKSADGKKRPVGFINFDGSTADNSSVEVCIPFDDLHRIQRGQYVLIGGGESKEGYLGRITHGPFFSPDAVGRDSAFARTAILMANEVPFLPDYHGVCQIELLGEVDLESFSLTGHPTRPAPKSQVWVLEPDRVAALLKLEGNMYIGHLTGYEAIKVEFNSHDKKVLPRDLGGFGTVGSGKTNTAQVLIEEAIASGWSVIVLDVEGEYVRWTSRMLSLQRTDA